MNEQQLALTEDIDPNEFSQMDLALGDEIPRVDRSKEPFKFTTERLWVNRPDVAKAAIKLIAAGFSGRSICRKLNLSYHTYQELRYRSLDKIEDQKKLLRSVTFAGLGMALERTIERIPEIKEAKDAAVVAGILGDKYLQFSGEPTAIIDIRGTINFSDELRKLNAEAERKLEEMKRAQVTEIKAETLK